MAEWMRHLSEYCTGQATVRLDFFGTSCASLGAMMAQQSETVQETASVSGKQQRDGQSAPQSST